MCDAENFSPVTSLLCRLTKSATRDTGYTIKQTLLASELYAKEPSFACRRYIKWSVRVHHFCSTIILNESLKQCIWHDLHSQENMIKWYCTKYELLKMLRYNNTTYKLMCMICKKTVGPDKIFMMKYMISSVNMRRICRQCRVPMTRTMRLQGPHASRKLQQWWLLLGKVIF